MNSQKLDLVEDVTAQRRISVESVLTDSEIEDFSPRRESAESDPFTILDCKCDEYMKEINDLKDKLTQLQKTVDQFKQLQMENKNLEFTYLFTLANKQWILDPEQSVTRSTMINNINRSLDQWKESAKILNPGENFILTHLVTQVEQAESLGSKQYRKGRGLEWMKILCIGYDRAFQGSVLTEQEVFKAVNVLCEENRFEFPQDFKGYAALESASENPKVRRGRESQKPPLPSIRSNSLAKSSGSRTSSRQRTQCCDGGKTKIEKENEPSKGKSQKLKPWV